MKGVKLLGYNGIYVHHVGIESFGYVSFNSDGTHSDSRPAVYGHHWLAQSEIKQALPLNSGGHRRRDHFMKDATNIEAKLVS